MQEMPDRVRFIERRSGYGFRVLAFGEPRKDGGGFRSLALVGRTVNDP